MNSETNIKYSSLKRYLRDLGYGDKDARRSIKKLRAMDPALKQAFALYFNEGLHPEMAIAEITFQELTSKIKMNPVTAFLFLDWHGLRYPAPHFAHGGRRGGSSPGLKVDWGGGRGAGGLLGFSVILPGARISWFGSEISSLTVSIRSFGGEKGRLIARIRLFGGEKRKRKKKAKKENQKESQKESQKFENPLDI